MALDLSSTMFPHVQATQKIPYLDPFWTPLLKGRSMAKCQAMGEFHQSILGQLAKIDRHIERMEEQITESKRRGSITSATSQSSYLKPSPSPSAKKLQVIRTAGNITER